MTAENEHCERDVVIGMYDTDDRKLVRTIAESKTPGVSRAQEIVNFAKCAGLRKIGIAHCIGVTNAADTFEKMLTEEGFVVTRADCKVFGLDAGEVLEGGSGPMCNPVGQAEVLTAAGTELNVAMGLCLGHDMLFAKHSTAAVTTLVVKDRVHAHNPIAALRA